MVLFLFFYYLQLTGAFNSFSRMLMNMVLTYCKLVITEFCRPFESEILYNTERNAKRILVVMFLATLVRIVPYITDTDNDASIGKFEDLCHTSRHTMAGIMIWASYALFGLLICLSFVYSMWPVLILTHEILHRMKNTMFHILFIAIKSSYVFQST